MANQRTRYTGRGPESFWGRHTEHRDYYQGGSRDNPAYPSGNYDYDQRWHQDQHTYDDRYRAVEHDMDEEPNTWLGDTEETYDEYGREPYSQQDRRRMASSRYQRDYPQRDRGRSEFPTDHYNNDRPVYGESGTRQSGYRQGRSRYYGESRNQQSRYGAARYEDDRRYNQQSSHPNYYASDLRDRERGGGTSSDWQNMSDDEGLEETYRSERNDWGW